MLHHVSFCVRDPARVAQVLAGLLRATTVRAPTPPFPAGSWFVCAGDARGSYLEVLPLGHVFAPDAPGGLRPDPAASVHSGGHILVSSPLTPGEISAAATAAGWRSDVADTRLFQVIKVWVENTVLVEFLTADTAADYLRTFDKMGLGDLDARLRQLEAGA